MCNVFKKGKNAQTLDKHLNVNTSIHCRNQTYWKSQQSICSQVKWYKNSEFPCSAVVKNDFFDDFDSFRLIIGVCKKNVEHIFGPNIKFYYKNLSILG